MPQMKVENRCCSELTNTNDAPETHCVTYEIRDESSPDSSPPLNGFLKKGQLLKSDPIQDTYNGSKREDKMLSVLSKNPDPSLSDLGPYPSNVVNDIKPTSIVNGHCSNDEDANANKSDIKSSLFSDSLLSSLTCKLNKGDMKVINGCDTQVLGDFSDLLSSISIPDQESKGIRNSSLNCTKQNGHEINYNAGLLDILSSISFDETDTSQKNSCSNQSLSKSSLNLPCSIKGFDSNKLISDFSFLNSDTNTSSISTPSKLQNKGSLSEMLLSVNFQENYTTKETDQISTTLGNQNLENDSLFSLKELSTEFLGSKDCNPEEKCFSFSPKIIDDTSKTTNTVNSFTSDEKSDFSFFSESPDNVFSSMLTNLPTKSNQQDKNTHSISMLDLLKSVNTDSSNPVDSLTSDEKNDFSFFSVSPDNVFSSMLTNLPTNSNQQDKNTNENTDNISMLDLLKSVNTDSSGSLSGYLGMSSQAKEVNTVKQSVSDDLSKVLDIDLSGCVKTSSDSDKLYQDLPVNGTCMEIGDTDDVKPEDNAKPVFEEVDLNRPRVNKSQSLFAKALSCKPKRNTELLRKAFCVKSELYKLYFNREFPDNADLDKDFKIKEDIYTNTEMVVCKTNDCMVTFKGRRFCPYEVNLLGN
ncbi:hypothetical protein JTE90_020961 [Oedothorax gibbosus]|uniref:Uncharacterized protein n=1 Tax=Oedothorax gibbosus TaxID=931172 RepID=A0AAV6U7S8_9ARAC|nr:hypothetical protein JTE90_020961 [Oedothorax gibbosus]